MGTKDAFVSMEIVSGKFASEFVKCDLEAIVCGIIEEREVVYGLGDCEVIILNVDCLILWVDDIRHRDSVDSVLDSGPESHFELLEHSSIQGECGPIGGRICSGKSCTKHESCKEGSKH